MVYVRDTLYTPPAAPGGGGDVTQAELDAAIAALIVGVTLYDLIDFRKMADGAVPATSNGDGIFSPSTMIDFSSFDPVIWSAATVVDGALRVTADAIFNPVVMYVLSEAGQLTAGRIVARIGDCAEGGGDWTARIAVGAFISPVHGSAIPQSAYRVTAVSESVAGVVETEFLTGSQLVGVETLVSVGSVPRMLRQGDRIALDYTAGGLLTVGLNGVLVGSMQVDAGDLLDTTEFDSTFVGVAVTDGDTTDVIPAVEWVAHTSPATPFVTAAAV